MTSDLVTPPPRTVVRELPVRSEPPPRRRLPAVSADAVGPLTAAALGSLGATWVLYERLLPFSGGLGFWLFWYAGFLGLTLLLTGLGQGRVAVRDQLSTVLCTTAGLLLLTVLGLIVGFVAERGWHAVVHANFFTDTMAYSTFSSPLNEGGIYASVVATLEQLAIAVTLSVPLGIATALYLNEIGGRLARVVRIIVETMSAIPSIVSSLFIYALLILTLGFSKSGLAVSLVLGMEMLPVVTRTAEVVFRLVPNGLREASLALGASQWSTVRKVVLPTARAGLATAVILGLARVVGETSPTVILSGFTKELNKNPTNGPQMSLPAYVYNYVRQPFEISVTRAFGAALVLLAVVLVLFVVARLLGGARPGELTRRQRRRIAREAAA